MIQSDWFGCYNDNWKNEIAPDAFAHPAKYSRALIRRIYQHVLEEGWIVAGDTVIDPFAGVALGGRDALQAGLHWVGVELEPRFVELGNRNIALWQALAERAAAWGLNGWGTATLLQGDSRELAAVLSGAEGAGLGMSSPPFTPAGSQPVGRHQGVRDYYRKDGREPEEQFSPANLGNMREGSHAAAMAVSSPPYASNTVHGNHGLKLEMFAEPGRIGKTSHAIGEREMDKYGDSPANLGNMREGSHAAAMAVSSPPWENNGTNLGDIADTPGMRQEISERSHNRDAAYGDACGQLGNDTGTDFWQAARAIVEQLRLCLRPGAHAVWVLKGFVRDKAYVDFPMQWAEMCQACGFELLHWHRAWLVEEHTGQLTLEGEMHTRRIERKSFFRRLAERRGSPRVDFEVVLCTVLK